MTDLEKHVSRPGRDKLVKKVREKIDELGITYIFFQFISVTGRIKKRACGFKFRTVRLLRPHQGLE